MCSSHTQPKTFLSYLHRYHLKSLLHVFDRVAAFISGRFCHTGELIVRICAMHDCFHVCLYAAAMMTDPLNHSLTKPETWWEKTSPCLKLSWLHSSDWTWAEAVKREGTRKKAALQLLLSSFNMLCVWRTHTCMCVSSYRLQVSQAGKKRA